MSVVWTSRPLKIEKIEKIQLSFGLTLNIKNTLDGQSHSSQEIVKLLRVSLREMIKIPTSYRMYIPLESQLFENTVWIRQFEK